MEHDEILAKIDYLIDNKDLLSCPLSSEFETYLLYLQSNRMKISPEIVKKISKTHERLKKYQKYLKTLEVNT